MTIIERKRLLKNISQNELSRRSGVKQSVISDIESGKTKNPRPDTVKALADILEFNWPEFYSDKNK